MTQLELAEASGLTNYWISHYECNRRSPCLENLVKLAKGLSVTTDELIGL